MRCRLTVRSQYLCILVLLSVSMLAVAAGLWYVLGTYKGADTEALVSGVYDLAVRIQQHSQEYAPSAPIDDGLIMNSGSIYTPAAGYVSSRYGYRRIFRRNHYGIDIANAKGTHLYSALDGVVSYIGPKGSYGLLIEIDHGNGIATRYGHCEAIMVRRGERVSRGEYIGQMGSTGRSTGPHLHFEILLDGKQVDPEPFINIVYK